jgi:cyd operon protein YbgT
MWYFAWILGASLAVSLAVLNAMLCEARECAVHDPDNDNNQEH